MDLATLPLRRKLLYAAILSAVAGCALLVTCELVLRLAGYGYSTHFARRVALPGGEIIWRENRWCTAPYFSPALVRRPVAFRLPEKKAPGTYRVFVLGSSAAMGDPESSFSFARILETMLRAAYPQQRFEIVNAAITATNSHVARGIAADCAQLEPDLFIVYEGHNEVIGPFGPSAVFAPFLRSEFATRTVVALKATRTGQLIAAASRAFSRDHGTPEKWGGMQMFLGRQIAADDPRLGAMRAQFLGNVRAIADSAQRVGAKTLLCTVLTNQRDFAPFLSLHRAGLTPDALANWQRHFTAAEDATRTGNFSTAEKEYRAALLLDDAHAELVFRLGRLALQAGRDAEAQALLRRALDLDALRFRTDSALNQAMRDLSAAPPPGLELADLAASLASRSEHGVPGDDLLYEHVHLTLRGAYEIARELFPRVTADLARRGLSSAPVASPLSYEEVRLRLGFTAHEQAMIALELLTRFRAPPFTAQSDHAQRLRTWERRAEQTTTLLARPDALPALRALYQQSLALNPDDWMLSRNAGMAFATHGAAAEALPLLRRAAAWIDDDVDTLIALGVAHRALGEPSAADQAFAAARHLEPGHPGLPR